jgi:CubicO group peptidase (beta-lactamase class C family)
MKILNIFFNVLFAVTVFSSMGCIHSKNLKPKLDAYLNELAEQKRFSGSVLVAKDGQVLLSKGYGMANYEHGVPNTPQTKFRLASITKQFTATAIMQLQELGLLSVSDTVSKYIPKYPNGDKITIHHLLTHTSGIPNVTSFSDYKRKKIKPHTLEQLIERFKDKPLEFEPGERFQYSNSGYMLLSYIIEKVSGQKYEDFLKENIFKPLGMNDSGFDKSSIVLKNRASGYSLVNDVLVNADYIDMSFPAGAGALYSTVVDLYRWDQALYSDKLLSKKSIDTIFFAFRNVTDDNEQPFPGFGYGWITRQSKGRSIVEHSGAIDGFSNDIRRYLEEKLCIIVLGNIAHTKAEWISHTLAAIASGEKYEWPKKRVAVKIDPIIYDQYIGRYKLDDNFTINISKQNNMLFAQLNDRAKIQLFPESETEFFQKWIDIQLTFVKDANGKVRQLILHDNGDHTAEKVE